MRFSFFKSLTLAVVLALETTAKINFHDDIFDSEYELAQLLEEVETPKVMAEAEAEELPTPAELT